MRQADRTIQECQHVFGTLSAIMKAVRRLCIWPVASIFHQFNLFCCLPVHTSIRPFVSLSAGQQTCAVFIDDTGCLGETRICVAAFRKGKHQVSMCLVTVGFLVLRKFTLLTA